MIVVADTTPLNYLVLIGHVDLLPLLYGEVMIPPAVRDELLDPESPVPVRRWIESPPSWLLIRAAAPEHPRPLHLDAGESEAIALAEEIKADYLAMDERAGRLEASRRGLEVIGTLGILKIAHSEGFIDLKETIARLSLTNFHASADLLKRVLDEAWHSKRK
jgi:predicted nucleic acid-binding protein